MADKAAECEEMDYAQSMALAEELEGVALASKDPVLRARMLKSAAEIRRMAEAKAKGG